MTEPATPSPRYFSAADVERVLTWPMVNAAVEQAFRAVSKKSTPDQDQPFVHQPQRSMTFSGANRQPPSILFTMPGFVGNYELPSKEAQPHKRHNTLACKLVTSFPGNEKRTPAIRNILANIVLFDTTTGQLQCIVDGTQITAWRTASASIVATKYLYFQSPARPMSRSIRLAIVGCGVQGRSHAIGMCATFEVSEVFLWNRSASKAAALAVDLQTLTKAQVQVVNTPAEAVREADVICIATNSAQALITADMLPKRPVHINSVGAGQVHFGEVAADIYAKSRVYVDNWASAEAELKGLPGPIVAEVGEVINDSEQPALLARAVGAEGITIFQSTGMAAEDATVAQAVYEALIARD